MYYISLSNTKEIKLVPMRVIKKKIIASTLPSKTEVLEYWASTSSEKPTNYG